MTKHFMPISILNFLFIAGIPALSFKQLSKYQKTFFRYTAARASSSGSLASLEPNQLPFQ